MSTTSQDKESPVTNLQTPFKKRKMNVSSDNTDKVINGSRTDDVVTDKSITNDTQETNVKIIPIKENKIDGVSSKTETTLKTPTSMDTCGSRVKEHNDTDKIVSSNMTDNIVTDKNNTDKIVNGSRTDDVVTDKNITTDTQKTNVELSPIKENKIDGENSKTETTPKTPMSMDVCGSEVREHDNVLNDNITNTLEPQNISSMIANNTHNTSNKANDSLNNLDNTSCNNNKIDNSVSDKDRFPFYLSEFQDFLQSPPFKKTEKLQSDNNIVSTNEKVEKTENGFQQFCDTMTSELCNSENLINSEVVDLLHNKLFNTPTNVEDDTKTPSDILLSSMSDINILQYIDGLGDLNKDPLTDPPLISDREEKDNSALANSNDKKLPSVRKSTRIKRKSSVLAHEKLKVN